MKRRNFLKLIGIAAATAPTAKLLGLPKDADGFYLDTAAPGTESANAVAVIEKPFSFMNIKGENLYVALYGDLPSNASGMNVDYKEYSRVAVKIAGGLED